MADLVNFFMVTASISAILGILMAVVGFVLMVKRKKPVLSTILLIGGLLMMLLACALLFTLFV